MFFFIIFALKHNLWVLVRAATVVGGSYGYQRSIILAKNKKNITIFHLKINIFTALKNRGILHRRVIVLK